MKPHMIITPADVLQARIRLGLTPLVQLDRAPGSSLHTDEHDKCRDFYDCPCWNVLPADPADREPLDILTPFDATSSEDEGDDFRSGLGDAYLTFYDPRYQHTLPAMTCDGLVAFMTTPRYEDESERHRLGYIAGLLIAFGESNPRFLTPHEPEDYTPRAIYTVLTEEAGFPVQFINLDHLERFTGPFSDPGEACQEFECAYGAALYLDPEEFAKQAEGLSERNEDGGAFDANLD